MIQHIVSKLDKALEAGAVLSSIEPIIASINIGLKFDYTQANEEGEFVIITGNKEKPHGISVSEADAIILHIDDVKFVVLKDRLKHFIKTVFKELPKTTSEDYKHIGVKIHHELIRSIAEFIL